MAKLNVYELSMKVYKTKELDLYLTTHFLETNSERTDHVTLSDQYDTFKYRDYEVVLLESTKKNHLRIYGFREI